MKYDEWSKLDIVKDDNNPFTPMYVYPSGEMFFVEPAFYTQFSYLIKLHEDRIQDILDEMEKMVKKEKKVIFCHDYEHPLIIKDGFIYLEIEDITNPLKIFVEDKSRGSDYGD